MKLLSGYRKIRWLILVAFVLLCATTILNEVFDLPSLLPGNLSTKTNHAEIIIEVPFILLVMLLLLHKENGLFERQSASEERLIKNEEKYRAIFENTGTSTIIIDESTIISLVNSEFTRLSGYSREEIEGKKSWTEFIVPEDLARMKRQHKLRRIDRSSALKHYEFEFMNRNNEIKNIFLVIDMIAGTRQSVASLLDITERKCAENRLKESEEKFRILAQTSPMAIMLYKNDKWIYANPAAEEICGYSASELKNMNFWTFVAPEYQKIVKQRGSFRQKGLQPKTSYEFKIITKSGESKWILLNGNTIKIDGVFAGIITVLDVTKRKYTEDEKSRLQEQMHKVQKLDSIGRLAGGVAHDLNNLLAPIIGYSEIMLENTPKDSSCIEPLEEIARAGVKARDLVHQLLAFSRKQTLEWKPVDLNNLLKKFKKLLSHTIREDIAIRLVPGNSLPPVQGDSGQLEQVIMNLSVNAQDAMLDGGELVFETSLIELDEHLATEDGIIPSGCYAVLKVSDTGCGMDEITRHHLFEPFFTTKDKDMGIGLGMATVFGIVKQHGGYIQVQSESGRGSTFTIYLPASPETSSAKINVKKKTENRQGSETILLVEDNRQVRELSLAILKQRGYTVLVAESGKDALEKLRQHKAPLHLVLTDVIMPGMNGKELFNKLSALRPGIKVLYMSGYAGNVIQHHGITGNGIHFIQKPFSVSTLASKVREVLELDQERVR